MATPKTIDGQQAIDPSREATPVRRPARAAAVGVDADSDYQGDTDDPAALARLEVGGVDPEVGPMAFVPGSPASLLAGVGIGRLRKA